MHPDDSGGAEADAGDPAAFPFGKGHACAVCTSPYVAFRITGFTLCTGCAMHIPYGGCLDARLRPIHPGLCADWLRVH